MIEATRSGAPTLEGSGSAFSQGTVWELFEGRVRLAPDSTALVFEGRELTYRELHRLAGSLAHSLVRLGVGPEVLVGLHLGRSLEMVVALMAVHRAGGAYVPLDPAFPADRLEFMARDSGVKVVLTDRPEDRRMPTDAHVLQIRAALAGAEDRCPEVTVLPENLAYVIYTSGSTGRPKGVQVTHGALTNFLLSMKVHPGFGERDVLVAVTTLSFDIAGLEIFLPLVSGGRVVVASREVAMDGARLADLLEASGATVLQATPVTWKLLLQAGWKGSPGLRMLCGGEELPRGLARQLFDRGAELWNLYGPTETTIWSGIARVEPGDGPVLIGRPIAATDLLVLDESLQPVPPGTPGDLYIGGQGLARGYLGRPALTSERFVPSPFGDPPGARLYRTGDLARVAEDGQLDFLGRSDHQVKIRGFRIELGEIESVLMEHPSIKDAVVVASASRSGERRLVSYVVPGNPGLDLGELQELLAARLPEYMRPAAFMLLDALPLTPNNKVDRRALPEVQVGEPALRPSGRTLTEEIVLGIWTDLLETAVGADDDFFALGGQSLLAGQVIARLRQALGIELPPGLLFEHPTPARFASAIETRMSAGARALLPLERILREEPLPVSHAQERLWLYDQLEPGSNAFNLGYAFRLRGRLSASALDASLVEICRRHEVLRTRIIAAGRPLQAIDPPPSWLLAVTDLSDLPAAAREESARHAVLALQSAPFDLARGPVLRSALLRLAEDDHVFCLAIHHIACDGWSLGILILEVTILYEALSVSQPSPLPDLPVQYADFGVWQRRWLQGEVLEEQLTYWVDQIRGDDGPALLPTDRPAAQAGGALEHVRRTIPAEVLDALVRFGRTQGATLFMTLLSALSLLIHRYTGRDRIVVGTMHANRVSPAIEDLIGFFANVLPLQTSVDPRWTFQELLAEVRRSALEAYAHQDAPFEKVVERVRPDRLAGRSSIFQVMVVFQNVSIPPLRLPGVEVEPFEPGASMKRAAYDLTVSFVVESRDLLVWVEYDAGIYARATAERLIVDFERVLRDVAADPAQRLSDLPRPGEAEPAARRQADGTLWLTHPAEVAPPGVGAAEKSGLEIAQERSTALQEQVAARRSKLSDKQLALLRQRLRK